MHGCVYARIKQHAQSQRRQLIQITHSSGVQRSGNARGQLLNCMPPPKLSSTQDCDKDRHLKYVKASVEKKFRKIQLKYFKEYFFVLMC